MYQAGNAVHRSLERNGDLLLDLLSGDAGPLRDDLDIVIRDVGIGLNRQIVEGDDSPGKQHDRQPEDEQAIAERKIDNSANHWSLVSESLVSDCFQRGM